MTEQGSIAFIGLGRLGLPVAKNLLGAGHALRVYNRTASKAEPLAASGAVVVATPADSLTSGGVVVTLVWDDAAVLDVVGSDGFLERLGHGGLHVSMSTIHPDTARRLAAMHERAGSTYVAAPIFGVPDSALAKELIIPLSGPAAAKERARPLLDAMGAKSVFDFGEDVAAATLVKLIGNFLIVAGARSMAEVLGVADKAGVDRAAVIDLLTTALLPAPPLQRFGKRLAGGDVPMRGGIFEKDVGLITQVARESGAATPLAKLLYELVRG